MSQDKFTKTMKNFFDKKRQEHYSAIYYGLVCEVEEKVLSEYGKAKAEQQKKLQSIYANLEVIAKKVQNCECVAENLECNTIFDILRDLEKFGELLRGKGAEQ